MSDADAHRPASGLGYALLSALKAACAGLSDRSGLSCEIGPRPGQGSNAQLVLYPMAPQVVGTRRGGQPGTQAYQIAIDCELALRARGSVSGDSFRAEALRGHFLTSVAIDSSFEVPITAAEPDDNVPEGEVTGEIETPVITVDAEVAADGTFYESADPNSKEWNYDARWDVTVRFTHVLTESEEDDSTPLGDYELFTAQLTRAAT